MFLLPVLLDMILLFCIRIRMKSLFCCVPYGGSGLQFLLYASSVFVVSCEIRTAFWTLGSKWGSNCCCILMMILKIDRGLCLK